MLILIGWLTIYVRCKVYELFPARGSRIKLQIFEIVDQPIEFGLNNGWTGTNAARDGAIFPGMVGNEGRNLSPVKSAIIICHQTGKTIDMRGS